MYLRHPPSFVSFSMNTFYTCFVYVTVTTVCLLITSVFPKAHYFSSAKLHRVKSEVVESTWSHFFPKDTNVWYVHDLTTSHYGAMEGVARDGWDVTGLEGVSLSGRQDVTRATLPLLTTTGVWHVTVTSSRSCHTHLSSERLFSPMTVMAIVYLVV
jgi:hypothetical protein